LSEGRIGWALEHAADGALLEKRQQRLDRLEALLAMGRAERMAVAAGLASGFAADRDDVYAYLELWQSWWRDLLLVSEGREELTLNGDRLPSLRKFLGSISLPDCVRALEALASCRQRLVGNANARLALEVLVLRLPRPVRHEEVGPA
jgi:DNA polymerase-3 subunit delta'